MHNNDMDVHESSVDKEALELINSIRERNYYRRRSLEAEKKARLKVSIVFTFAVLTLLSATFTSLVLGGYPDKKYIDRKQTQEEVALIISNGGDLRAVKRALENRPNVNGFKVIFSSGELYYPGSVALSYVLEDVRLEAFRDKELDIIPRLEEIISEHEERNPFDKLQVGQKDYFESVRIKTGEEYKNISNDVNNIADELHNKNQLVDEYLVDSKTSFWVSILAVILSLMIGGYQIYAGRPEALRKVFYGILDALPNGGDSDKKENDNSPEN